MTASVFLAVTIVSGIAIGNRVKNATICNSVMGFRNRNLAENKEELCVTLLQHSA